MKVNDECYEYTDLLLPGIDDEENEKPGILNANQESYCWRLVGSIFAIHKQVPM